MTKKDDVLEASLQKKDIIAQGKRTGDATSMGKGGVTSTRPTPTTPTKRVPGTGAQSRNAAAGVSAVGAGGAMGGNVGRGSRGGMTAPAGKMGAKGGQSLDKRKMTKEERLYAPRVRKNPADIKVLFCFVLFWFGLFVCLIVCLFA